MTPAVGHHLRRLDTIAFRATAIFVSILILLLVFGALVFDWVYAGTAHQDFRQLTVKRIVATVTELDREDGKPGRLIEAMNDPTLRAAWYTTKPAFLKNREANSRSEGVSCYTWEKRSRSSCGIARDAKAFGIGVLAQALDDNRLWRRSKVRALYFRDNENPPQDADYENKLSGEGRTDLLPSRRKAIIAVEYRFKRNTEYAAFIVATDSISPGWAWRMAGRLLFTVAAGVLLAGLATYLATVPVRHLSLADPAPEAGPREMRRIAEALKASQERLQYAQNDLSWALASLTHDMRTALIRLRMRIEDIDDDAKRDRAEGDLAQIETLLHEAYEVARYTSNEEPQQPVDLASLTQALCDSASDAGQTARYRGPDLIVLNCQPSVIRRALANLIDNAIAYGGEVDVELSEDDETIRIVIGDRGPGIPATEREAAFQPFRRLEISRSRETGGMGLGLPIARNAIQRCGGDIVLHDREGGGLEVLVTLPKR